MNMDASRLGSRIRDVLRQNGTHPAGLPAPPPSASAPDPAATADALGGALHDAGGATCVVVEREYPGHGRHGYDRIGECARLAGALVGHLGLLAGRETPPARAPLLFFDLETTGLSGGAGTHAFLVGCGCFDGDVFRTRQFFLTSYAAEPGLLRSVADRLEKAGTLVTFNGKTFDLPVIETRFLFHRLAVPGRDLPHLDMLHPARRMWRSARAGTADDAMTADAEADGAPRCTLGALEQAVLGVRRTGDVPGSEVPARYFHYVRTGQAGPLEPVFEHNRLDLLSLAGLTVRALRLVDGGVAAARSGRECLALGRLYERVGRRDEAATCYDAAAGWPTGGSAEAQSVRIEARRHLAAICRRARRHADAAALWEALIEDGACPPAVAREAAEALAIHHEHRSRNLAAAHAYAQRCLRQAEPQARQDARRRLARVERKLAGGSGRNGAAGNLLP